MKSFQGYQTKAIKSILLCFIILMIISSCEKPPGVGGNSTVKGRIWVKDYPTLVEYAGSDEYVYIIYGNDVSYGDRIRSSYDGQFEFKYLRKGKYKIYTYSMALSSLQDSAVIREIEIPENGKTIDLSNIIIYK